MTNIAFIGLGIMGSPMAVHLAKAGHPVAGYNRSPDKAQPLVDAGGTAAESIADAVRDADVVCVMVPDSPDVTDVLTGEGGVFDSAKAGALVIDFSSIRPDVTVAPRRAGQGARASGSSTPRSPAARRARSTPRCRSWSAARPTTSRPPSRSSTPSARPSCTSARAAPARPSRRPTSSSSPPTSRRSSEAVVFLEAYGVDTKAALEVLGGGLAGSKVLDQKKENMLSRSFEPGFRIDLHHKDMGIVTAAAREAGVVVPLGSLVAQLMGSALGPTATAASTTPPCCAASSGSAGPPPRRRTDMARMRAVDAAVLILEKEGATQTFGLPGAAINPFYSAMREHGGHQARAGPPRRGRLAHGRGLHPRRGRQHRRLHRYVGPGRHRHDHRPLLRLRRLDPDPLHHRPGARGQAAQGGLPGGRHRLHRQAGLQVGRHGDGAGAGARARSRRRSRSCARGGPGPVLVDLPIDVQLAEIDFDIDTYEPLPVSRPAATRAAGGEGAVHAQRRRASADRGRRRHHQRRRGRPAGRVRRDSPASRSSRP